MDKLIYEWERNGRKYRVLDNARLEIMVDWGEWAYAHSAGLFQGHQEEALGQEILRLAAKVRELQAKNFTLQSGDVAKARGEGHAEGWHRGTALAASTLRKAIKELEGIAEGYEVTVDRGART